jgi:beta-glucosidase
VTVGSRRPYAQVCLEHANALWSPNTIRPMPSHTIIHFSTAPSMPAGRLDMVVVDQAATRVTSLCLAAAARRARTEALRARTEARSQTEELLAKNHALARQCAAECAVLLKNERNLLPLTPGGRVALLGGFARVPRHQGSGSSKVNSHTLDIPLDAITETVEGAGGASFVYRRGGRLREGGGWAHLI